VSVVVTTHHVSHPVSSALARSRARMKMNVGSTERWLSLAAGGVLAVFAAKRRSPGAAIVSAGLLLRGITGHCSVRQALGISSADGGPEPVQGSEARARLSGSGGVLVEESVTIRRDIQDVYRFWRRLENLPQFLGHLQAVTPRSDGTSHWVARGPAGIPVEWDARIINDVENKVLGWQSLDGSAVATAGSVNFRETAGGTSVRVRFQYDPPGGKVGAALAALLGEEPGHSVREDLGRLKSLLEKGSVGEPR